MLMLVYLGKTISNNLFWGRNIGSIVSKGNLTLGFIRRNLKDCTQPFKAAAYTSVVRPKVESCTVCDPSSQKKIISQEQVQKRAARFVRNNYSDQTPGCVTLLNNYVQRESLE